MEWMSSDFDSHLDDTFHQQVRPKASKLKKIGRLFLLDGIHCTLVRFDLSY